MLYFCHPMPALWAGEWVLAGVGNRICLFPLDIYVEYDVVESIRQALMKYEHCLPDTLIFMLRQDTGLNAEQLSCMPMPL